MPQGDSVQLVVFADDWGRHPSSAQHLVRRLLPDHPTLWVNTVGTRRPRWSDLGRVLPILANWFLPRRTGGDAEPLPANLRVISPRMYPGFRTGWQRRLNARLLTKAVNRSLITPLPLGGAGGGGLQPPHVSDPEADARSPHVDPDIAARASSEAPSPSPSRREGSRTPRTAVTTLPITADLVGKLHVDHWVYYCVDDFSVWPGLDSSVMQTMERELVAKVDAVVCVSEVLRERVRGMGREAELLTHGVDLEHWASASTMAIDSSQFQSREGVAAVCTFWGLVDKRMECEWVLALAEAQIYVMIVGPVSELVLPDSGAFIDLLPPDDYAALPQYAAVADVLIMPYINAPVTRAMQPLKLLEYLATYKPVVVRDLPATRAWADCCDVVATADEFVRVCLERAQTGLPPEQRAARERRLPGESWAEKARRFAEVLYPDAPGRR